MIKIARRTLYRKDLDILIQGSKNTYHDNVKRTSHRTTKNPPASITAIHFNLNCIDAFNGAQVARTNPNPRMVCDWTAPSR
jgi:hypothetical protein